jgi:hydrogenase maturation protease
MRELQVAALGNPMMSDDGIGLYTLSLLQQMPWPPQVRFHSLGTGSLAAAALLRRPGRLLLFDALQGGERPGTVFRLRADRLLPAANTLSLHEWHLLHLAARFYPSRLREITVLGLEPADLSPGLFFSHKVLSALPLYLYMASLEISMFLSETSCRSYRISRQACRENKRNSPGR